MNAQGRLRVRDQIEIYTKSEVQQRKPFSFFFLFFYISQPRHSDKREGTKANELVGKKKCQSKNVRFVE